MKFALAFLSLLFLSIGAEAAPSPYFTTVFYDGNEFVYAGLKSEEKGNSSIVMIDTKDMSHKLFSLPESIAKRDVIGAVSEGNKIFVITQMTSDPNDNPLLSIYKEDSNSWKDIHSVDCPIFTQVNFSPHALIFHCENLTKRGKSKVKRKSLSLGSEHVYRKGAMRFPEFLIRYKRVDIRLEGIALAWSKLRIKMDTKEQIMAASELLPITAPAAALAAPVASPAPSANPVNSGDAKQ